MKPSSELTNLQVFVINRSKDTARREIMTQRLAGTGFNYHFFEAVDGHSFDAHSTPEYDGKRRRQYFGRDLTAGEIGCLLSHRALYKKMLEEGIERALILEDDTILSDDFPETVAEILASDLNWDIFRFLNIEKILKFPHRLLLSVSTGYNVYTLQKTPGGAFAYMVTQEAAERLLRHTERSWLQIDIIHGWSWQTKLKVVAMIPSPVDADYEVSSTIGEKRFDKTLRISGMTLLLFPLYRMWFKLSSGVGKRYAYHIGSRK